MKRKRSESSEVNNTRSKSKSPDCDPRLKIDTYTSQNKFDVLVKIKESTDNPTPSATSKFTRPPPNHLQSDITIFNSVVFRNFYVEISKTKSTNFLKINLIKIAF